MLSSIETFEGKVAQIPCGIMRRFKVVYQGHGRAYQRMGFHGTLLKYAAVRRSFADKWGGSHLGNMTPSLTMLDVRNSGFTYTVFPCNQPAFRPGSNSCTHLCNVLLSEFSHWIFATTVSQSPCLTRMVRILQRTDPFQVLVPIVGFIKVFVIALLVRMGRTVKGLAYQTVHIERVLMIGDRQDNREISVLRIKFRLDSADSGSSRPRYSAHSSQIRHFVEPLDEGCRFPHFLHLLSYSMRLRI